MIRIVVLFALFTSGCAALDKPKMSGADWTMEAVWQAANIADGVTTSRIQRYPDVYEANPIARGVLGENPATRDTILYFATLGLSHYLIARSLPPKWRKMFQSGTTVMSIRAVENNCDNGLC
jgi:hypothetical protein